MVWGRGILGLALICAALAAPAAQSADVTPAEVIAAERAFAADAQVRGFIAAFKTYAAPEAIGFQPDPVNIQESLANEPDEPANKTLKWWPVWGGIAKSGELGFTTGPYTSGETRFGTYFTVWAKQANGTWRWIFDGGPRTETKSPLGPETIPSHLAIATKGAGSSDKAWSEVSGLEAKLASTAATDTKAAYQAVLAEDARVMGSTAQPATDASARATEIGRRAPAITFSQLGGRASKAGDLAFTYGDAKWQRDGKPERGHYVRIWQMRNDGWKLVVDEILAVPPAPPAP